MNKSIPEQQIRGSPSLLTETVDYGDTWWLLRGGILNIYGQLSLDDIRRIDVVSQLSIVQFARRFEVSRQTLKLLDDWVLAQRPSVRLQATLNGYGAFDDLEFLAHLSFLRRLAILGNQAMDLRPIVSHGAIEDLNVGGLGTSLSPLHGFDRLTTFGIFERVKGLDAISSFSRLETLTISGQKLKHLAFLLPLQSLRRLNFAFGSTTCFDELSALPALKSLSIWRTRKVEMNDLRPLNDIAELHALSLRELPRIRSFDWLNSPSLRSLELEKLGGVASFASLGAIPNLETLILRDAVTPRHIAELAELPALKEVYVYEGYGESLKGFVDKGRRIQLKPIEFPVGVFPRETRQNSRD